MKTRRTPDFWGLHKNKNCAFSLKHLLSSTAIFEKEEGWGATTPGPVKGINASQLPIRNFNDIKGKCENTTGVFLRDFTQEPKHFKCIFVEKKYLFLFVKRYIFPVQLINVKKTDKWFITCYRMQLWGIRTLGKDNLKNNLVKKNVQRRVS